MALVQNSIHPTVAGKKDNLVLYPTPKFPPGGAPGCVVYIGKSMQTAHAHAQHDGIFANGRFQHFEHFLNVNKKT